MTPDYVEYHMWQAASLVLASATGVLSTTALLQVIITHERAIANGALRGSSIQMRVIIYIYEYVLQACRRDSNLI